MNNLLSHFSWTQFALLAGVALLAYYVFVLLIPYLLYLKLTLPGRSRSEQAVAALSSLHDGAQQPANRAAAEVIDVIGKPRLPEGVAILDSRDLVFEQPAADEPDDSFFSGLRDDLSLIFAQLSAEGGTKADFIHKMDGLREFYQGIASHPAIKEINSWVVRTAPFELKEAELQQLWA